MKTNIPYEPLTMPETRPENAPDYFHVMAKPTGAICNLDCEYCLRRSGQQGDGTDSRKST